jgi:hypothetical protein
MYKGCINKLRNRTETSGGVMVFKFFLCLRCNDPILRVFFPRSKKRYLKKLNCNRALGIYCSRLCLRATQMVTVLYVQPEQNYATSVWACADVSTVYLCFRHSFGSIKGTVSPD